MHWQHAADLNEDFRLLWTIINQDITFEIQVRTLGYVGFGFSKDGQQKGADMAVGWVEGGHTFFQVSSNANRDEKHIYQTKQQTILLGSLC